MAKFRDILGTKLPLFEDVRRIPRINFVGTKPRRP